MEVLIRRRAHVEDDGGRAGAGVQSARRLPGMPCQIGYDVDLPAGGSLLVPGFAGKHCVCAGEGEADVAALCGDFQFLHEGCDRRRVEGEVAIQALGPGPHARDHEREAAARREALCRFRGKPFRVVEAGASRLPVGHTGRVVHYDNGAYRCRSLSEEKCSHVRRARERHHDKKHRQHAQKKDEKVTDAHSPAGGRKGGREKPKRRQQVFGGLLPVQEMDKHRYDRPRRGAQEGHIQKGKRHPGAPFTGSFSCDWKGSSPAPGRRRRMCPAAHSPPPADGTGALCPPRRR